jgi:hypothetical protein
MTSPTTSYRRPARRPAGQTRCPDLHRAAVPPARLAAPISIAPPPQSPSRRRPDPHRVAAQMPIVPPPLSQGAAAHNPTAPPPLSPGHGRLIPASCRLSLRPCLAPLYPHGSALCVAQFPCSAWYLHITRPSPAPPANFLLAAIRAVLIPVLPATMLWDVHRTRLTNKGKEHGLKNCCCDRFCWHHDPCWPSCIV